MDPYLLPVMRVSGASAGSLDKANKIELDNLSKVICDEWELCPTDITVDDLLGEGAFGEVYKGFLKGPLSNTRVKPEYRNLLHIPVAIKLLKGNDDWSMGYGIIRFYYSIFSLKIQLKAVSAVILFLR